MRPNELRTALSRGMIETRYQPIVRLADRVLVALEVLARLKHPSRGTLPPRRFVTQMEDAGLAPELTEQISQLALMDMKGPSLAPLDIEISLNFPLGVMLIPEALTHLDAQRHGAGIPPRRVTIELTESQPVDDLASLRHAIELARRAGYGVAIDDLAPTMANLDALLELPFSAIKLDKDVVQHTSHDQAMRHFVRRIVDTARSHSQTVTAEGVEDVALWRQVKDMGVQLAQGFLLARPLQADAIPAWLRRWQRRPRFD